MSTLDNLQEADGTMEEKNNPSPIMDENTTSNQPEVEQTPAPKTDSSEPTEPSDETQNNAHQEADESATESNNGSVDYETMDLEALVLAFEQIIKGDDLYTIRPKVNQIKKVFNSKFTSQLNAAKTIFLEGGGNSIDFSFKSPYKKKFNALSKQYREKNEAFEKNKSQTMKQNLESRLEIIEQIKGLIDVNQDSNVTYNNFKKLQERWRNLGKVPLKEANSVWNNYRHHVGKFYDFLHLNRDLRDRDYQYNLEQKQKLIRSAEALAKEENLGRAFRELQALHKIWKEELGPVARAHRDSLWEQFSAATKVINDKRQQFNAQIEQELLSNHETKERIIAKINTIAQGQYNQHSDWQKVSKKVEQLREEFFKIGGVPKKMRSKSWTDFKSALRTFTKQKNTYYKSLKKNQSENLKKKKELVEIAEHNKNSDDFETTAVLMKDIQNQWKTIGHIPRKESSALWKQFRGACNHFFDRYYEHVNAGTEEENQALKDKEVLLESLKGVVLEDNQEANINRIKEFSTQWSSIGNVPKSKRQIDTEFYNTLTKLYGDAGMSKEEIESLKYTSKLLKLAKDPRHLNKEISFVRKKIDDIASEINQLENNLQFFSNVKDDNPMVLEVQKNIEAHKMQLNQWNKKLSSIKKIMD